MISNLGITPSTWIQIPDAIKTEPELEYAKTAIPITIIDPPKTPNKFKIVSEIIKPPPYYQQNTQNLKHNMDTLNIRIPINRSMT